jgi:hypothetical protein
MRRPKLATKITLLIVAVMIVGFGVSTLWSLRREEALLVDQNKMAARRLTATLVASIEAAMLQERPDVTRTVLSRSWSPSGSTSSCRPTSPAISS